MATMMEQRGNQQAYKEALKALEKDRVDEVKAIVKAALEALQQAERARREAVDKIHTIKRDLDDLKHGRLGKIKERHEKDKKADAASPITPAKIERIIQVPVYHHAYVSGATTAGGSTDGWSVGDQTLWASAVSGTYVMDDGSVKSL